MFVCGLPRELFLVNCRQPVRIHAVSDEPLAAADCARDAMCQGNPQESVQLSKREAPRGGVQRRKQSSHCSQQRRLYAGNLSKLYERIDDGLSLQFLVSQ